MKSTVPVRLLYSARTFDDVIYRGELTELDAETAIDVHLTLTRGQPDGWAGYSRRIDRELLEEVSWPAAERRLTYVCGPTSFVETAASGLVELGHDAARVRTERFGATGT